MSNDLQTNLGYIIMIDYDKLRQFFAFHAVAKKLKQHLPMSERPLKFKALPYSS